MAAQIYERDVNGMFICPVCGKGHKSRQTIYNHVAEAKRTGANLSALSKTTTVRQESIITNKLKAIQLHSENVGVTKPDSKDTEPVEDIQLRKEQVKEMNECSTCHTKFEGRPAECPGCKLKFIGWE